MDRNETNNSISPNNDRNGGNNDILPYNDRNEGIIPYNGIEIPQTMASFQKMRQMKETMASIQTNDRNEGNTMT